MKKVSQYERVHKVLSKSNKTPGVTPKQVAKLAKVPLETVYKRVHDMRVSGVNVYTNFRKVNGRNVMYYRVAN